MVHASNAQDSKHQLDAALNLIRFSPSRLHGHWLMTHEILLSPLISKHKKTALRRFFRPKPFSQPNDNDEGGVVRKIRTLINRSVNWSLKEEDVWSSRAMLQNGYGPAVN